MLRADCYGGSHDIFETEILSKISEVSRQSSHGGSAHVLHLLDKFKHRGPNGEHVCLVFDVLGHHLDFQTARYEDGKLPVKAVKIIARQLLLGLDYLHRECGIIHTGMKCHRIHIPLFALLTPSVLKRSKTDKYTLGDRQLGQRHFPIPIDSSPADSRFRTPYSASRGCHNTANFSNSAS